MEAHKKIERLFKRAKPPVSGSTTWYDACDLLSVAVKQRLRRRFKRGFQVEVYGDEVGVILRVRGDGYGVDPWNCAQSDNFAEDLRRTFARRLPEAHLSFYRNLHLSHEVGDYLFVHAGVRPGVALGDHQAQHLALVHTLAQIGKSELSRHAGGPHVSSNRIVSSTAVVIESGSGR